MLAGLVSCAAAVIKPLTETTRAERVLLAHGSRVQLTLPEVKAGGAEGGWSHSAWSQKTGTLST